MVALRRFQDLMRMLTCQTPASAAPASPINSNAMNKSTQTPDQRMQSKNSRTIISLPSNSTRRQNFTFPNTSSNNREHNRLSRQIQRRNTSICNNQYQDIISSDDLLSQKQFNAILNSTVVGNYVRNRVVSSCSNSKDSNYTSRRTLSVAPNRNNHSYTYTEDTLLEKSPLKKNCDNNFIRNCDRSMKVLSRNNSIKTPPVKDHKFSRYTPLPAINQADNNLSIKKTSPEQQRRNRRLMRQLTYKVINPLFVKGPSDLNRSPNRNSLKKSSRCSTPVSQVIKRSKTIVIKKNKSVTSIPNRHMDKDHKSDGINLKSVSYQNTSVENQINETESNRRKSRLMNRGKSFIIPKKFIEAAEKIKDGQPIVENAFWIQF